MLLSQTSPVSLRRRQAQVPRTANQTALDSVGLRPLWTLFFGLQWQKAGISAGGQETEVIGHNDPAALEVVVRGGAANLDRVLALADAIPEAVPAVTLDQRRGEVPQPVSQHRPADGYTSFLPMVETKETFH